MLSATLSAKLHRWYLESQQQEHQAHEVLQLLHHDIDAKHINDTRMEQTSALTCLCLDAQQSNQLGILQKQTGRQSADEANSWLQRKVEFATMSCNISPRPPTLLAHEEDYCALEAAASTEISYMNAAEEDKFASEMIEELLGHNCACGARIELVISSPSNSLSHDSISTTTTTTNNNNNNNSCKCS
jgi:hypothetical protein